MITELRRLAFCLGAPVLLAMSPLTWALGCPPQGEETQALFQLSENQFSVVDDQERNRWALGLLGCVGHPDPAIRDGVVYGAYSTWLRAGLLWPETIGEMRVTLSRQLKAGDTGGFLGPFAALDLSEVARVDRMEPLFTQAQRQQLVEDASGYLEGVRDYRGYSNDEGWRHGVAHGADLALQLVLNENIDSAQVTRLIDAIRPQITPAGEIFYTFGEPSRLARPVFYAYLRSDLDQAVWDDWFTRLADPAPLADWSLAWKDRSGLARRHNLMSFMQALYISADLSTSPAAASLKERVLAVMEKLM